MTTKQVRTVRTSGDRAVHLVALDQVIDTETLGAEERRAMIREGRAEWRTDLDASPGHESILVRVAACAS